MMIIGIATVTDYNLYCQLLGEPNRLIICTVIRLSLASSTHWNNSCNSLTVFDNILHSYNLNVLPLCTCISSLQQYTRTKVLYTVCVSNLLQYYPYTYVPTTTTIHFNHIHVPIPPICNTPINCCLIPSLSNY